MDFTKFSENKPAAASSAVATSMDNLSANKSAVASSGVVTTGSMAISDSASPSANSLSVSRVAKNCASVKPPVNLHKEFVSLNFQIIGIKNRLIFLLLEIYEKEMYKKHGCATIYEYAFRYAKLSKERVQKALRTLKNTENTPEVRAKIETCGLDKVALVAKLATPENQHLYAQHVENMSTPALQAFTKEIRQGKPEAPKMTIELDEEMQVIFNQFKKKHGLNLSNQQTLRVILKSVSEDVFSKTSQPNTTEKPLKPKNISDAHPLPTAPISITPHSLSASPLTTFPQSFSTSSITNFPSATSQQEALVTFYRS